MTIRKRKRFKNMLSAEKRLEMKINEHKMLMNTLHEMFRKNDVPGKTLEMIKAEINDTIKEIEELRKEAMSSTKDTTVSMFDGIKKNSGCCGSSTCTCHHNYGLYDNIAKSNEAKPVNLDAVIVNTNIHDILFTSGFVVELDDLNIPSNMVQFVTFLGKDKIEIAINDFITTIFGSRYPILSVIEGNVGRKFTMTIKRIDQTGAIVYKEKYVGCEIEGYFRSSLEYTKTDPSQIMLQIKFDGVSYETAN